MKQDFPSADYVGNSRYVFNIRGNNYRIVVLIVFFAGTAAIRFVGTHSEYDKIKDIKKFSVMTIKSESEYKEYEARVERLIERGTELGDMELLNAEEKEEFTMLSAALDEYGRAFHPMPGQMSTLLTDAILLTVKEKGLKQKDAARMIGISQTVFSDLLHHRRTMSYDVARNLHKVLGIPAEIVLA